MASNVFKFSLSNGKGIEKIIHFSGLEHELTIHPTIHGSPILTSQAFYYLKNLDSIAFLKIKQSSPPLADEKLEYLIDNYLFEYSAINLSSRITTKVSELVFWRDEPDELYQRYDQGNTGALVLDEGNDPAVVSVKPIGGTHNLSDWCIPKNYTDPIIENYVSEMHELLDKKVMIQYSPNNQDAYIGKKRIFELEEHPLDLHQAERLDWLPNFDRTAEYYNLPSSFNPCYDIDLPIINITSNKLYNPLLLSYYFSGLNDRKALGSYVGYYNVLEYYFEEAPTMLGISAKTERTQLQAVIKILVNYSEIKDFISSLSSDIKGQLSIDITTSSNVKISALNISSSTLIDELARWLYELRCAVVHSKKTRFGKETTLFQPYSQEADNIKIALPFVRWLAISCIKKDYALGNGQQHL